MEARDTWNKTALLLAAEMGGHKVPRATCFTRTFTSTKVQMLTPEALLLAAEMGGD